MALYKCIYLLTYLLTINHIRVLTSSARRRRCLQLVPSRCCRRRTVTWCSWSSAVANDALGCTLILGLKAVGVTATSAVRERQTFAHCRVVVPSAEAGATGTSFSRKCTPTVYSQRIYKRLYIYIFIRIYILCYNHAINRRRFTGSELLA